MHACPPLQKPHSRYIQCLQAQTFVTTTHLHSPAQIATGMHMCYMRSLSAHTHTYAAEGVYFAFSAHAVVTLDPVHFYHRIKGYSKYVER